MATDCCTGQYPDHAVVRDCGRRCLYLCWSSCWLLISDVYIGTSAELKGRKSLTERIRSMADRQCCSLWSACVGSWQHPQRCQILQTFYTLRHVVGRTFDIWSILGCSASVTPA